MLRFLSFVTILGFSNLAFSQTCDSTDKREMIEQLDCFCNAREQTAIAKKLEKIGSLQKTLGLRETNCDSAVRTVITSSKEDSAPQVSKKLQSLGYTTEQVDGAVKPLQKLVEAGKLVNSKKCNTKSLSITIWPFSFNSSKPPKECEDLEKLSPEEKEQAYLMAMGIGLSKIAAITDFSYKFKEIDEVSALAEKYPHEKIAKCHKFAGGLSKIEKCLDSKADDARIAACSTLIISDAGKLSCLETNATALNTQRCSSLYISEKGTLTCLQIDPTAEVANSCKNLYISEAGTLSCLQIKPTAQTANSCKNLYMSESNTLICIQLSVKPELIAKCGSQYLGDAGTVNCLRANEEKKIVLQIDDTKRSKKEQVEEIQIPYITTEAPAIAK